MNVDIINGSTARWWLVIVLSITLFALVIGCWGLLKTSWVSIPINDTIFEYVKTVRLTDLIRSSRNCLRVMMVQPLPKG